jgi:NTP pyrophosphatase (non-canonical NTP hydrolase)
MHFKKFDEANRIRCEAPDGFNHKLGNWSMSDWLVAVLGELGEAANIVKKLNRVRDGIPGNKETPEELRAKLENELADADIYLSLLYQAAGIDRETAILETFNRKSKEIGYPGARTASELNARDLVDQLRDEW